MEYRDEAADRAILIVNLERGQPSARTTALSPFIERIVDAGYAGPKMSAKAQNARNPKRGGPGRKDHDREKFGRPKV